MRLNQSRGDYDPVISSAITYGFGEDRIAVESNAKRHLIDLYADIQEVKMYLRKTGFEAGDYIDTLLSTTRPNMRVIEIVGGTLQRQYNNENAASEGGQLVNKLQFQERSIDEKCLSSLLTSTFPKLKLLRLSGCKFKGSNDNDVRGMGNSTLQILMPQTVVGKLDISGNDYNKRSILLISIHSIDENITKCYMDINAAVKCTEISQKNFDAFCSKLKTENMGIVYITAKSIKNAVLTACDSDAELYRYKKLELF